MPSKKEHTPLTIITNKSNPKEFIVMIIIKNKSSFIFYINKKNDDVYYKFGDNYDPFHVIYHKNKYNNHTKIVIFYVIIIIDI